MDKIRAKTKLKKWIIASSVALGGLLSFGFADSYFEVSKNLDIFATLFRELNIYYVDDTKPGELMKKGIDAMLESLDPYTNYIPESEIEDYRYMTTGQYGGIGSLIQQKGDYVMISEPYEGFAAYKADLRAGDLILEVDGVSAKGKKTDDLSKILKGQPGTSVKVLIQREGEAKPIEKTIVREEIVVKNVSYYGVLQNNIGYIKLTGFTENAARQVKDALVEMKEKNGITSLILDMRGNPGGLLREAVDIVNIFVDKGQEVVSTKGKVKDWDRSHKALNLPADLQIPIAVLVDRGSASASEIVSGAIQDLDRGVVIGQRTFGKGLVQQTRPLTYNAQLKVTVAKYYIPSGRCIQALDYSHRNEDGSVDKVPDSLISVFSTKNGRLVYDGGGIEPDIKVEPEDYANISKVLVTKQHIFDYVTKYRIGHPSIQGFKEFSLNDEEYSNFIAYLDGKDYNYDSGSEKKLDELAEAAKDEKYFDDIKAEYDALRNKVMHNKKEDLSTFKPEIKQLLEEEIASRYGFQKGRLEASFKADREMKEAINILSSPDKYKSILTTVVVPDKPAGPAKAGKGK